MKNAVAFNRLRFIAVEGESPAHGEPGEDRRGPSDGTGSPASSPICATRASPKVMSHYHGLWQVEECFRITKHDLRVRPHLALELGPDPRPHRHRLHGLRLRPPPGVPASPSRNGGCPRRSSAPPSSTANAPSCAAGKSGNRYVIPLEADTGSGTDLRDHGAAPDDHAVPARLIAGEARPGPEMPDVVPSQKMRTGEYQLLTRINRRSQDLFKSTSNRCSPLPIQ